MGKAKVKTLRTGYCWPKLRSSVYAHGWPQLAECKKRVELMCAGIFTILKFWMFTKIHIWPDLFTADWTLKNAAGTATRFCLLLRAFCSCCVAQRHLYGMKTFCDFAQMRCMIWYHLNPCDALIANRNRKTACQSRWEMTFRLSFLRYWWHKFRQT